MKTAAKLALIFIAALLIAGCGKKEESAPQTNSVPKPSEKKLTIAVIPKGTMHEFWKSVNAGAIKASEELNVNIIWKGPVKEDDRDAQISVMEDFLTKGVDGICLAPLDDAALRTPVSNAVKSNIPVVIFDSSLKGSDFCSFVATDNFKGGQTAGGCLGKLLNGKGSVIMLRYAEGSASTNEREKGFMDAIAKFPGIKVISSNQYGGVTPETAYKAGENLLARFKKVDGFFCPNESTTFGMLRALQDGGLAGKVKFVGFDGSKQLVDGLTKGDINGLVLQNPVNMGYLAVKTIVAKIKGEKIETRIDTGATLVTKDNMTQPEIKELLQPDLDRWLK